MAISLSAIRDELLPGLVVFEDAVMPFNLNQRNTVRWVASEDAVMFGSKGSAPMVVPLPPVESGYQQFLGEPEPFIRPPPPGGLGQYFQQPPVVVEPLPKPPALVPGAPCVDVDAKPLRSPATPQAPTLILD